MVITWGDCGWLLSRVNDAEKRKKKRKKYGKEARARLLYEWNRPVDFAHVSQPTYNIVYTCEQLKKKFFSSFFVQ